MPKWICLKGRIRGGPPPKKVCFFLGGGRPPFDFQNYSSNLDENFFETSSDHLRLKKIFFRPRRIFYARRIFYEYQFFWKNRLFWGFLSISTLPYLYFPKFWSNYHNFLGGRTSNNFELPKIFSDPVEYSTPLEWPLSANFFAKMTVFSHFRA